MRKFLLIAGAATLAVALPTVADAQGRGNGRGNAARAEQQVRVNANRDRDRARARAEARAQARAQRSFDRNGDGIDDRAQNRYGGAACPPGLANRTPACIPPGQARRIFREGQRVPTNYRAFTSYNDIPLEIRQRYNIPDGSNYIYRDNSVYVVNPRTRLITDIINLLGR